MNDPFFFGYGSLVNRKTHDYGQAHPAKIKGWRRAWRRSPLRNLCFLTAVPDPDTTIEGLIAAVPNADWAALDIREHGYLRHEVTGHVEHDTNHDPQIAIYAIPPEEHASPTPETPSCYPIWMLSFRGIWQNLAKTALRIFSTLLTAGMPQS